MFNGKRMAATRVQRPAHHAGAGNRSTGRVERQILVLVKGAVLGGGDVVVRPAVKPEGALQQCAETLPDQGAAAASTLKRRSSCSAA